MTQQINLFNPIFLKQKKQFSAVTMAQGLGLIFGGALLLMAYSSYQVSILAREASTAAAQVAATQARLDSVRAQSGQRAPSKELELEIQRTEAHVQALRKVLETVDKGEIGNTKGYADYLRAFARQITPGTWLTGFSIRGAGQDIVLQGRALQPDLVPSYINRLGREPILRGKGFATLEMRSASAATQGEEQSQDKDKPAMPGRAPVGYVEFNLQSTARHPEDTPGVQTR